MVCALWAVTASFLTTLCCLSQPTTLSSLYGRPPFPFSGVSMDACLTLAAHLFILILKSSEEGGSMHLGDGCREDRDIDFRGTLVCVLSFRSINSAMDLFSCG